MELVIIFLMDDSERLSYYPAGSGEASNSNTGVWVFERARGPKHPFFVRLGQGEWWRYLLDNQHHYIFVTSIKVSASSSLGPIMYVGNLVPHS